ncbi:glycosyltransferase family 2 protein [Wenzhouxiangella sp. AB-CW3]|uniref:glycosyltransferase family 2 protein n=1 Tax=Wenzhouxiangella sp. AB-CW3 TaxID=2771012 RepID=UPI00168BFEC7|nr:glycosyltransferase family 2 protein [Wenzhouxiangella sp. AB-CW3]QOC23057.1 glycosyltransferase family 2 protein [Wenzhouxiangella sp. AB-CW3]
MIAVVVPVFNAPAETARCLAALAATVDEQVPVVVIDDASDDVEVAEVLAGMPSHWVRVHNEKNLGFVATANLGMALAGEADIVLLNADTQVTAGWLEAIRRCANSDTSIASITPLTNNGEIASIPEFCRPNPWPEDAECWARACRESGEPMCPEVPTGVGFCMYLRRACLDCIGEFDEQAFGRGYGEENDWCMRAMQAGWRHVLCDEAFVAHQGGASFGPLGLAPGGQAMETLLQRYPDYMDRVSAFIEADPMATRRQQIINHYNQLAANATRQPRT